VTSHAQQDGRVLGATCVLLLAALMAAPADAAVVASDGFDSSLNLTNFSQTPTLQTVQDTWAPGDWFGELDPLNPPTNGIPFAVTDDSFSVFPEDDQGVIDNSPDSPGFKSDKYFGVVDLENDLFTGTATATWVFDISGAGELSSVSIDMGAMGNFEASGNGADRYDWQYKIDDGPELDLFISAVDEDIEATYTLSDENGTQVTLPDPLTMNGELLLNGLTTLTAAVSGSGNALTLLFESTTNGGSEAYAFDNIVVENVAEVVLGDMDCDGDTDFDDIDDFVLGLNDPAAYESLFGVPASLKGDADQDGDQDFDDIDDFVGILTGASRATQVPEPSAWMLIVAGALGAAWMGRRRLR